jgi:hypothetical protein
LMCSWETFHLKNPKKTRSSGHGIHDFSLLADSLLNDSDQCT